LLSPVPLAIMVLGVYVAGAGLALAAGRTYAPTYRRISGKLRDMTQPTDFVYTVQVIQVAPSPGDDYVWLNRHEVTADPGLLGDADRLNAIATAFAVYHANILLQGFRVDRIVISTYGPDLPWPPGFASIPGPWGGQRSNVGSEPLPLEAVLFVRRNVVRGRDGKLFLRGALTAAQVDRFGNVDGDFRNYVNNQSTTLLNALAAQDVQMVMASGPIAAVQTRQVLSLQAVNFRTLQFRNRRKSAILRYQLGQAINDVADPGDDIARIWQILRAFGITEPPPLLPPPPSGN